MSGGPAEPGPDRPLQPLDAAELRRVLDEIRPLVEGGRVSRVVPAGGRRLILEVRRGNDLVALLVSTEPLASRLHLTAPPPPRADRQKGPVRAAPFELLARRELEGRWLLEVQQPGGDRLVALRFGARPQLAPGQEAPAGSQRWLLAELTGRHANLFMATVDPEGAPPFGHLMGSLAASASSRRDLRPGQPYVPLLPLTANLAAGPDGSLEPAPAPAEDRFATAVQDGSLSAAMEAYFEAALALEHQRTLRSRIEAALRRGLARARRRALAVEGDLGRHTQGETHRRQGEALLVHLAEVPRGASSVRLADPHDPDRELVIDLDPALNAQQNAALCFKRHRKARQGLSVAQARHGEALAEAARFERELEGLGAAALPALLRIAQGLGLETRADEVARPGRHQRLLQKRRDDAQKALPYRRFTGQGGEEILVGKGARENDLLTFKVARGNDVWLHTRDAPGAHVVIRLGTGRDEPHHETLLDAATLAAHYSELRREGQVDVTTTRCKNVRKAKGAGAAPGAVYLSSPRTVRVRLEPARLQRLFGTAEISSPET